MKKRIRNMDLKLMVVSCAVRREEIRKDSEAFRNKIAQDLKIARSMQCADA